MGMTSFDWPLSVAHPGDLPHGVGIDRNGLEITLSPSRVGKQ
jgi:hypothetical protein